MSQFAGMLAIACAPVLLNGRFYIHPDFSLTRDVYLFFSITGFLVALALLLVFSFNMDKGWFFNRLPLPIIVSWFKIFIYVIPQLKFLLYIKGRWN